MDSLGQIAYDAYVAQVSVSGESLPGWLELDPRTREVWEAVEIAVSDEVMARA